MNRLLNLGRSVACRQAIMGGRPFCSPPSTGENAKRDHIATVQLKEYLVGYGSCHRFLSQASPLKVRDSESS
jgi:hypothetical protein